MNLTQMMEGLREGYKKRTKFYGVQLTIVEVGPILEEYDHLMRCARSSQAFMRETNARKD